MKPPVSKYLSLLVVVIVMGTLLVNLAEAINPQKISCTDGEEPYFGSCSQMTRGLSKEQLEKWYWSHKEKKCKQFKQTGNCNPDHPKHKWDTKEKCEEMCKGAPERT